MKAVVLETDRDTATLIRGYLFSLGFAVEVFDCVEDAQRYLRENRLVHLIVSDYHLPGYNGADFFDWVQLQPRLRAVAFIICTAQTDVPTVVNLATRGVKYYLAKPFNSEQFRQKILASLGDKLPQKTHVMLKLGLDVQGYESLVAGLGEAILSKMEDFGDGDFSGVLRKMWPDICLQLRRSPNQV